MEVFTTDDDGAGHLGRDDLSGEDTTTDRDETGEGALLVDVGTLDGLTGSLEPETDLLVPTAVLSSNLARGGGNLGVVEQRLLLEGLLNLFGHDLLTNAFPIQIVSSTFLPYFSESTCGCREVFEGTQRISELPHCLTLLAPPDRCTACPESIPATLCSVQPSPAPI